jgi:phosphatidylglycerophosphate synthase
MHVWRARLERWFTPLARLCPFSPNAITLGALAMNLAAAGCLYAGARHPERFLVAIPIVIVAGLADAFDGIVARVQQKTSSFGDFLDHFADRVSDLALLAGWLAGNGVRLPVTLLALICVMLNGYVGTQYEATWHERNYDSVGRGEFVLALIVFPVVSFLLRTTDSSGMRFASLTIAEWMALLMTLFAVLGIGQRLALAARRSRTP